MAEWTESEISEQNFDGLKLRSLSKANHLKLFKEFPASFPKDSVNSDLVQVSNVKDYAVLGFDKTFIIASTSKVQEAGSSHAEHPETVTVQVQEPIQQVLLSPCHDIVIIVCEGLHVLHYEAQALLDKTSTDPVKSVHLPSHQPDSKLLQLIINPCAKEDRIDMALFNDGHLAFVNGEAATSTKSDVVAACFSPAGDKVALALRSGGIRICDLDGTESSAIPLPPSLSEKHAARHLHWITGDEMLAVFWDVATEPPVLFCIDLAKRFTNLGSMFLEFDVTLDTTRFYSSFLADLAPGIPSLAFLASSQCAEVSVLVKNPAGQWYMAALDESFRVVLPYSNTTIILPRGIALDITASRPIHNLSQDLPDIPPVPVLYLLNSDGDLMLYHCISTDLALAGGSSQAMRHCQVSATPAPKPASDAASVSLPRSPSTPPEQAQQAPTPDQVTNASEPAPESAGASFEATLSSLSREVRKCLTLELDHPLLHSNVEDTPLSEFITMARTAPITKTLPPPSPTREATRLSSPRPYVANTQEYAEYRKLGHRIHVIASAFGIYKERWEKHVVASGEIHALSSDTDSLWDGASNAHQDALAAHNLCIEHLESLQASAEDVAALEQLLSQHTSLPNLDSPLTETDPTYQAIVTAALVNLEAKLLSFQNTLSVINRQLFSQQDVWARVLDESDLNSFVVHLQAMYARNLERLGKVAFIKSKNPRLDPVYRPVETNQAQVYLAEGIAAMANVPIPASAVAQAHDLHARQSWLDSFQAAYVRLHASP